MTEAIQNAITLIDQEIDALDQRRGELQAVRDGLEKTFNLGEEAAPRGRGGKKKPGRKPGPKPARANGAPDIEDDDGKAVYQAVLAGASTVKEIADKTKLSTYIVKTRLAPLAKAKTVVITGSGRGQRINVPGRDL